MPNSKGPHCTVQMKAVFTLRVGTRLQFVPDLNREGESNREFAAFATCYEGQACTLTILPHYLSEQPGPALGEPDDVEAAIFKAAADAERLYPKLWVRFDDGVEREIRASHFVALDVEQADQPRAFTDPYRIPLRQPTGERNPDGITAYSAATSERQWGILTAARTRRV